MSYAFIGKLEDRNRIQFLRVHGEPNKNLLDMFSSTLEFIRESPLPRFFRVSVERAFYVNEVIAPNVDADYIQLPIEASVRPSPNKNGSADEISIILKPLRNQLL